MNHLKERLEARRIEVIGRAMKSLIVTCDKIDREEDLPVPYAIMEGVELAWGRMEEITERDLAKKIRELISYLGEAADVLDENADDEEHDQALLAEKKANEEKEAD